jgi:hypothetical protein
MISAWTYKLNKKIRLVYVIRILSGCGLLALLLHWYQGEYLQLFSRISPKWFFLACMARATWVLSNSAKWWILLHGMGSTCFKMNTLTIYYMEGLYASLFLPSNIAGDGLRIAKVGRHVGYSASFASVLLDRVSALGMLLIFAIAGGEAMKYFSKYAYCFCSGQYAIIN